MTQRWDSQIKEDHRTLENQLEVLQKSLEEISKPEAKRRDLSCIVIRVLGPTLELHLRKEEEVLFPAPEKLLGSKRGGIELLQEQHGDLRQIIRELAQLVCQCGCEHHQKINPKEAVALGEKFVRTLQEHEKKEDQLLTDVLEASLHPKELMGLAEQFHKVVWRTFQEEL